MKITKLFRQHSRTLLMIIMSLLLVTFLIPSAVTSCGERGERLRTTRGHARSGAVSTDTLARTRTEMQLLTGAGFKLPVSPDATLEYYLLTEETKEMGLHVGRDEVVELLRQHGRGDVELQSMQQVSRRGYDEIKDVIGQWMAVNRLVELQFGAVFESLPRAAVEYRNATQQAVAQVSVIDSRALVRFVPEPTEEELAAFFSECKDRTTAHTSEKLEFGYRLPDRVQVEYLTVDPAKIKLKIKVKAVQVKQFFEDNAHRYTKPRTPASQPTQGPPPRDPMTFDEAADQVREDLREARAIEEAQRLVNDMYGEAHRPWTSAPKGDDGFTVPPDVPPVTFEQLKEKFSTNYEVEYGQTELVSEAGLEAVPGFGLAGLGGGRQPILAPALALRVKGILSSDPKDGQPVLNILEPAPVVLTRDLDPRTRQPRSYRAYLFRVVRAAPSAPPESMDAIRDQVVKDWKQVQAFERAHEQAGKLAEKAREVGLTAAVEQAEDLKAMLAAAEQAESQPAESGAVSAQYVQPLQPFSPPALTRQTFSIGTLGSAGEVTKALFDLVDKPGGEPAPAHRVAALPLADQFKWVVGELVEVKPIYEGGFEKQLAQTGPRGSREEIQAFARYWADPESVYQRTGFIEAGKPAERAP